MSGTAETAKAMAARNRRLADALRANLRRRKAALRVGEDAGRAADARDERSAPEPKVGDEG